MSLIADALKAAQEERASQDSASRSTARRLITAAAPRPPFRLGRARAVQVVVPSAPLPRSVRLSALVFVCAAVASAAIVGVAAQHRQPRAAEAAPSPAIAMTALVAAPAPAAAAVTDAAPPAENLVPAGESEAVAAEPQQHEEPPAREPRPVESAPVRTAASQRVEPDPAREDQGRFELTISPRAADSDSAFREAQAAQQRQDYAGAAALFRRVLARAPERAEGWASLGAVLSAAGDGSGAEAALAEALRLDPARADARVNLANLYLARGLTTDAQTLLVEAVRLQPDLAEARYALGRVLESQGDRQGAAREYQLFLATADRRFAHLLGPVRDRVRVLTGQREP